MPSFLVLRIIFSHDSHGPLFHATRLVHDLYFPLRPGCTLHAAHFDDLTSCFMNPPCGCVQHLREKPTSIVSDDARGSSVDRDEQ